MAANSDIISLLHFDVEKNKGTANGVPNYTANEDIDGFAWSYYRFSVPTSPLGYLGEGFISIGNYMRRTSDMFAFGMDDFTLEYRSYNMGSVNSTDGNIGLKISSSAVQVGTEVISDTPGFINNAWTHYALVRKNGVFYWFVNGTLISTVASNLSIDSKTMTLSGSYFDEWCVTKRAKWTTNFTPPTEPYDYDGTDPDPIDMKLHVLLKIAQTVNLTGHMHPVGPNPQVLVWSSEDSSIASVDQNGTVTGNAVGKTKIFVRTQDNSWSAFARIKVVEEGESELLLSVLLEIGESCILFPEFEPEDAQTAVLWSSSDSAIAVVSATGKVTGIIPGLVTITAKTADNALTDSMYVTVKA